MMEAPGTSDPDPITCCTDGETEVARGTGRGHSSHTKGLQVYLPPPLQNAPLPKAGPGGAPVSPLVQRGQVWRGSNQERGCRCTLATPLSGESNAQTPP